MDHAGLLQQLPMANQNLSLKISTKLISIYQSNIYFPVHQLQIAMEDFYNMFLKLWLTDCLLKLTILIILLVLYLHLSVGRLVKFGQAIFQKTIIIWVIMIFKFYFKKVQLQSPLVLINGRNMEVEYSGVEVVFKLIMLYC